MLDFFGFEILYLICNFIGGTIRWIYGSIYRTIFRKPKFKYKEYVFGIENSKNHFDIFGHHFNNLIITVLFIAIIVSILS
ncbi:hypothetical protein FDT66_01765 [Polaribacter aestuariivivens]|uniref:DUF3899 domain-containing protein n=1 Tax=Polaribacter aestuariivivens TaxID=2304626 RepID=A0A5S3NFI0_9FLAO|nr:hypothetical protein [Polaribacter aestuariivivens]TMM32216.1 hypothetical protein FDT66_01765 [Polaribacter aestuariivivens]